jgi:hypothetical protein
MKCPFYRERDQKTMTDVIKMVPRRRYMEFPGFFQMVFKSIVETGL